MPEKKTRFAMKTAIVLLSIMVANLAVVVGVLVAGSSNVSVLVHSFEPAFIDANGNVYVAPDVYRVSYAGADNTSRFLLTFPDGPPDDMGQIEELALTELKRRAGLSTDVSDPALTIEKINTFPLLSSELD